MKGCSEMNISKEFDNEIISRVLSENPSDTVKSAEELEAMLDKELSKPENEIDFGLVNELSIAVSEARGKSVDIDVNEMFKKFETEKLAEKKSFRMPKWSAGLIAACLILVFGNAYTVKAWNMNIVTFIVEFTKGGAIIDLGSESKEVILPTSESDPYGIIAKCSEMGINTETPHYIPEGFILAEMDTENNADFKYAMFSFKDGQKTICFTVETYEEGEQIGIPSDEHNISETYVNGHKTAVSREDNQMLAVFRTGGYLITVFTQDVDYGECDKILENIK